MMYRFLSLLLSNTILFFESFSPLFLSLPTLSLSFLPLSLFIDVPCFPLKFTLSRNVPSVVRMFFLSLSLCLRSGPENPSVNLVLRCSKTKTLVPYSVASVLVTYYTKTWTLPRDVWDVTKRHFVIKNAFS